MTNMLAANRITDSQVPDIASLSISSMSDYHVSEFPGKELQREQVIDLLDQQGFVPDDLIESEVDWFYRSLGIDDLFFASETPASIANMIHTLYSHKVCSFAESQFTGVKPNLYGVKNKFKAPNNHAIYMESGSTHENKFAGNSEPSVAKPYMYDLEIDDHYLDNIGSGNHRAVSFWTPVSNLKLTFVYQSVFPDDATQITSNNLIKGDIDAISDKTFTQIASDETKKLYGQLIQRVLEREGPVIRTLRSKADPDEIHLLIAYKRFTTIRYYSAINSLLNYYNLLPSKFFLESFKLNSNRDTDDTVTDAENDVIIYSVYFKQSVQPENSMPHDLELAIKQIEKEASLLYAMPSNYFHDLYESQKFSPQEAIYAHIGAIFINHFINRLGSDYENLLSTLNPRDSDTSVLELIDNLKRKLRAQTYNQHSIIQSMRKYSNVVSKLYRNFAEVHYYQDENKMLEKTLSYQRLAKIEAFVSDEEFQSYLNKYIPDDSPDSLVLNTLNLFNKSILKTNFFVVRKVAISFRLDPKLIMPKLEYAETPYGLFFVLGNTFKGFHIRFRDIARGGIRIVCSKNQDVYDVNSRNVIDENYQLVSTQQRKNKDIPEGGSKGVILLNPGIVTKNETFIAFTQYVDAMIDILIKDPLKEKYVDLLGHDEILFFGPDEGTAGFVNWATRHARKRNCPWWKSFLTGKSPNLGGIPHDEYGMTSLGVRANVVKIYETLGLTEKTIRKFQTGGPDGDLGSNEILLSTPNELYLGLLDGSGVLCDPNGLDKEELQRLARNRQMVKHFDIKRLSSEGFFVSVDDMDRKLPNGTIVSNGTTFRNTFHTEIFKFVSGIDIFVPCGGRPNSINLNNVWAYIDNKTGKCKIPYIVEGANLFIAQRAKLFLENHGCILIKDATANKGGVTSSSLEVLASLALNDHDFVTKFIGEEIHKDPTWRSPLYKAYVKEVQKKITLNAEKEFTQLWKLNQATGTPISELSNILSQTINKLNDDLVDSHELWFNDLNLRDYLLLDKIIPKLLIDVAGRDKILKNIPVSYSKVLLSSYLSSTFVYEYGLDINIGKFLEFIGQLKRELPKVNETS